MLFIVTGPPGSDKSMVVKAAQTYNAGFFHFSVDKFCADQIQANTEFGKKVAPYISRRQLIPDRYMQEVFAVALQHEHVIIDDAPKTLEQKAVLDILLDERSRTIDGVIHLVMSDQQALERSLSNRVCSKCHWHVNLMTDPPRTANRCDMCNGQLIPVEEDPVLIGQQLAAYNRHGSEVVFRYNGLVTTIDSTQEPRKIFTQAMGVFRRRKVPVLPHH